MITARNKKWSRWIAATVVVTFMVGSLTAQVAPAAPTQSSNASAPLTTQTGYEVFQQTWNRTDSLVSATKVQRSFYWGFHVQQAFYERYDQGPEGKHLVAYYDKARMEINNPNGDRSNPFYVTNGQLSRELVTGRVQVGDNEFVQLQPAEVDIASDTDDTASGTPTYASFRNLIRANPNQVGMPVSRTIDRAGLDGLDPSYGINFGVKYAYYEPATQNNIPDVFWNFLNQTGPITLPNGQTTNARLSDPYFYVTGYPISGAYWAKVRIAGKPNVEVLIQVYERRVLTYVPSQREGWRVQMGNVGQHYFEWRYRQTRNAPGSYTCEAPSGKTGQLWFARPDVQQKLSCQSAGVPEQGMTVAHQRFERGEMLDLINPWGLKTIYVLYNDGTAQPLRDQYRDGTPEPPSSPPPGLYAPRGGFGKVWRENNLQARLGWATAPETVATYDPASEPPIPTPVPTALPGQPTPRPAPPPPTAAPASNRGFPAVRTFGSSGVGANLIIYAGPTLHKFYVTYNLGTRWVSFDDMLGR